MMIASGTQILCMPAALAACTPLGASSNTRTYNYSNRETMMIASGTQILCMPAALAACTPLGASSNTRTYNTATERL